MFVNLHFHRGYSLGPQKSKPLIIYGIVSYAEAVGVLEMGGRDIENTEHMVTEVAIRAFYRYYREIMGF